MQIKKLINLKFMQSCNLYLSDKVLNIKKHVLFSVLSHFKKYIREKF